MKTVLVTSGGTMVYIDPVRHFVNYFPEDEIDDPIGLRNMSHGTFGSMIATEFLKAGHRVIFLCAKHSKRPYTVVYNARRMFLDPAYWLDFENEKYNVSRLFQCYGGNYGEIEYDTFDDYSEKLGLILKGEISPPVGVFRTGWKPDITVLAAAVSDYGVVEHPEKIRSGDALTIQMSPLPKLISNVKKWHPETTLVGFKLLVQATREELVAAARKSIETNNCDIVVANDLASIRAANHTVHLVQNKADGLSVVTHTSQEGHGEKNYLARQVVEATLARDLARTK